MEHDKLTILLHAHGITSNPSLLEDMLVDALMQLPCPAHLKNTELELSKKEAFELEKGGFDLKPKNYGKNDPIARYAALYAAMKADSKSVKETAAMLEVAPSRVRQKLVKERSLYGIKDGSEWHIPMFQFSGRELVPGIGKVLAALPDSLNPVSVLSWFMNPNPDLEVPDEGNSHSTHRLSPREWLLIGNSVEKVVELAEEL
jgi:hypothetical protein